MQIFFDFSAYSDMAIGLGKIFGFNFPENFNYPYVSRSIQEFWRRWHMSLSRWFRDYLYIPLGGSRKGKLRTYLNLWAVFLFCGLWHGASWNFIVWGGYYGLFLVLERVNPFKEIKIPSFFKHVYVLTVVGIGLGIFRSENLSYAFNYISFMFDLGSFKGFSSLISTGFIIPFLLGVTFSVDRQHRLKVFSDRLFIKKFSSFIYLVGLISSIFLIAGDSYNPFIYFRF